MFNPTVLGRLITIILLIGGVPLSPSKPASIVEPPQAVSIYRDVTALPNQVIIDHDQYDFSLVPKVEDDGQQLYGITCTEGKIISISKLLNRDSHELQDSILHEVLHASWNRHKKRHYTEEEAIRELTPGLLAFLQQNPKFVDYLRTQH